MDSLRRVAQELSIAERTLRRAASEGLIRGERLSPRRYRISLSEEAYLRTHWPLLRALRAVLRTEPNVGLAVLYGSASTGEDDGGSEVAILVAARDSDSRRLVGLSERLTSGAARDVQVVPLADAERSPALMVEVLEQGRVLIDRDELWSPLQEGFSKWRRVARREQRAIFSDIDDIGLGELP